MLLMRGPPISQEIIIITVEAIITGEAAAAIIVGTAAVLPSTIRTLGRRV